MGFLKTCCKRERMGILLKRFQKREVLTKGMRLLIEMHAFEENGTTVDVLLDPVSQEDQKQTCMYLSTHQMPKEMVVTQYSIIQIIHCDLSILQGSVATQLRYGGIFNNRFIAYCLESVQVKEC